MMSNKLLQNKRPVTLWMDADVLRWFMAQGKGYQTRINAVLRMYVKAQQGMKRD